MARPPSSTPTDRELGILQVLWDQGPSTVRHVHEALQSKTGTVFTTTLKMLQIMTRKGLVRRDESGWAHVYIGQSPVRSRPSGSSSVTLCGEPLGGRLRSL